MLSIQVLSKSVADTLAYFREPATEETGGLSLSPSSCRVLSLRVQPSLSSLGMYLSAWSLFIPELLPSVVVTQSVAIVELAWLQNGLSEKTTA